MKNIFRALIVAVFVLTLASITVFAENLVDSNMLKAVGVDIDTTSTEYVTRGEAANYLTLITGMVSPDGNSLSDVNQNHPYYKEINNVTNLGIMNGDADGKFYPDEEISGKDFLISIVRLAGYTDYAEATSGYPNGYLNIANRHKILPKGLNFDGPVTYMQAYEILSEAILMPYCNAVGFTGTNNNDLQIDYAVDSDYTVIEHYKSIVRLSGVVVAVDDINLKGYKASNIGTIGIADGDKVTYYKSDLYGKELYLGCYTYYWYDENNEKIVFLESQDDIERITLTYKDIESVSADRTKIRYYDGKKSRDIKLPYDVTFVYNGSNCNSLTVSELHKPNVRLTVVDVDDDKTFEVVFVEEFETVVVGSYVVEKQSVSDRRNGKTFYLGNEDFDNGTRFYKDGTEVDFKHIHIGSVLAILTDKEATKRTIYITEAVNGKVDELFLSENTLKIDGVSYETLFDLDSSGISVGNYVTLYMNHYGYCSDYEKVKYSGGEYAYLVAIAKDGGLSDKIRCKYINACGEIVISEFDEKFTVNSVRSDFDKLEAALLNGGNIHQLVYFRFKGDKIKNVDIANEVDGLPTDDTYEKFTLNYSALSGNCLVYGSNINTQFYVPSTTQTFYIPIDEYGNVYDDEVLAGDYENVGILSGSKPEIKIYDSTFSRIPGAVVVYGVAGKETSYLSSGRLKGTNAFVVEEISMKLCDDGEVRPSIEGMILGMPFTMYPAEYLNIDGLKSGDVIKMGNYRGNELRSYEKLFTLKREKSDTSFVLSDDGEYSDEILAYNKTGTKSKIDSAGIFGKIEEVGTTSAATSVSYQNDGAPKYSIVVRPDGSTDDSNLLTIPVTSWANADAGGTYIYLFNRRNNTAHAVSPMDIELTGKTVYCFTYNGLAKAIIIYDGGDE